jgi:c-di-GMP-binding flagellar brake protein YcgR
MPDRTESAATCRRRVRRYRLNHAESAFVDFDLAGGSHWRLSVVEISSEGFAFEVEGGRPPMTVGTQVDAVTIEMGGLRISGDMRVVHVTQETEMDTVCGVEFTPSTAADTRNLTDLITRFEEREQRAG